MLEIIPTQQKLNINFLRDIYKHEIYNQLFYFVAKRYSNNLRTILLQSFKQNTKLFGKGDKETA